MSKITVSSFATAAGSHWSGDTAYLQVFYYGSNPAAFSFSTGEVWSPSLETFYREIECVLASNVVTAPATVLDSTPDITNRPDVFVRMVLLNSSRDADSAVLLCERWDIPASLGSTVTFEQLRIHNETPVRRFDDRASLSRTAIEELILSHLDVTTRGITGVSNISTLTGLESDELTNGQVVYVAGYTTLGDGGQGFFRWDGTSTAETDGGVTFIPDDLTAAGSPYSLTYAAMTTASTNGFVQLPHTNIVWGSVSITYADNAGTVGSKWLHGHAVPPRHGVGGGPRARPPCSSTARARCGATAASASAT